MDNAKEYKKYKERRPEDTVNQLQNILHDAGLDVTYFWTNNEELECYSNRVQIADTALGTNGKGTSRSYALASGYAELMERLQNGALYTGALDPAFLEETGMIMTPDERFEKAADLAMAQNALMETFFKVNSCKNDFDKLVCINKWSGRHPVEGKGEDTMLTVPFASLKQRKVIYLPSAIYTKMYGTNGMCAGNTQEEALVQGMAEIFERYVNGFLLNHSVSPPTVPNEYLKKYPTLWERIKKIEKEGRYRVIVKDCSLGKGYPVVGTMIGDMKKGTFGFRLASHYSFPVALERTLTEALQGRDLESFTGSASIAPEAECVHKENIANIFKCGAGCYRRELFYESPSYEFVEWADRSCTNREILKYTFDLFLEEGYDILVRDVSFLGFPSYQILVPGVSEIYPADDYNIKEINTVKRISAVLSDLHEATDEDIERIRRLLRYKEGAIYETRLSGIFKRPFNDKTPGGELQDLLLLSACNYRLGLLEETGKTMELLEARAAAKQDANSLYYRMIGLFLQLKREDTSENHIREVLEKAAGSVLAEKVISIWKNPKQIFQKLYPKFSCWDCSNCDAAFMCDYGKTKDVLKSLRKRYKDNAPDQNELFKTL